MMKLIAAEAEEKGVSEIDATRSRVGNTSFPRRICKLGMASRLPSAECAAKCDELGARRMRTLRLEVSFLNLATIIRHDSVEVVCGK